MNKHILDFLKMVGEVARDFLLILMVAFIPPIVFSGVFFIDGFKYFFKDFLLQSMIILVLPMVFARVFFKASF